MALSQSAERTVLQTPECSVTAKYAPKPNKAKYLILSVAQIETLRFKLRLYLELQLVSETKLFQMQSSLQDIGRMATGWRKSVTS